MERMAWFRDDIPGKRLHDCTWYEGNLEEVSMNYNVIDTMPGNLLVALDSYFIMGVHFEA
jgi:hypothetical protein